MKHRLSPLLAAALIGASALPAATEPGILWEVSSFNNDDTTLSGVAINPAGRIVAVSSSELFLTSRPAVDFTDWIANESAPAGQDGPDDDPNGDGITNLAAYAHGIAAVAATTSYDLAALPRMLPPGHDGRLRLQLRVNTLGLGDLTYILGQTTTLEPGSWTEIFRQEPGQYHPTSPFPAHITSDAPDGTAVIKLLNESLGARPAYYTRLRAALTP